MEKNSKAIAENVNIYDSETSLGFGISSKFIDQTRENIKANDVNVLEEDILSLHPADIADIFEILPQEDRKTLFSLLRTKYLQKL